MRGKLRHLTVGMAACLLAGALVAGVAPAASSQQSLVPDLTLDELLAIGNVDAPPAGIGLQIHADFPAEAPLVLDGIAVNALTADVTPSGDVVLRRFFPARMATGAGSDEATHECSDDAYVPSGPTWNAGDMPIFWRMRLNTIPAHLDVVRTRKEIRRAHRGWPRVNTRCSEVANDFHFFYLGATKWRTVRYDGVNLVEFGDPGSGALAINYTWYSNSRIIEVDLRFNKSDYRWTNLPRIKDAYHVINVASHELGHQLGLDDLSDPHGALTMFARIGLGERSKVTLGKGDVRGAARLSP